MTLPPDYVDTHHTAMRVRHGIQRMEADGCLVTALGAYPLDAARTECQAALTDAGGSVAGARAILRRRYYGHAV